jgi:multiple sugar transport system permease protein
MALASIIGKHATASTREAWLFKFKQQATPYLFLVPSLLVLGSVLLYPLLYSFILSFHRMIVTRPDLGTKFIGLDNYIQLFSRSIFYTALRTTLIFTASATAIELVAGFTLALAFDKLTTGKDLLRSIILVPLMMAPVAVGIMWQVMLHDQYGVINYLLGLIGLQQQYWFSTTMVMPTMTFLDAWQMTPFVILVILAGLQGLPHELYEAGDIDGASRFQKLRFITLPMMKQIIFVVLLIRAGDAFRIFDRIWITTEGGPGEASTVMSILAYKQVAQYSNIGYGSAISWVILIVILAISLLFIRLMRDKQGPTA